MILITTAGKVGAQAARLLAGQQIPVRVLVRDPAKDPARTAGLVRFGAEIFTGDLADPASVDQAMKGVSTVLLVSPAVPAQELNVVAGALRAGVGHVVKITSKASLDSPIARRRGQAEIENELIASGLGYTLLRNNAYMQNFLMPAAAIARTDGFAGSVGDGRIGMIDSRDVAAVAASIAASPEEHAGKTYWPTGPERLSYPEAAAILSKVLGRPIGYRRITPEQDRQAMIDAGLPPSVAADNVNALGLFDQGDADYVTGDVPALLGRAAGSFERFVIDHAAAFGAPGPNPTH